jgi:hypothetical protein
LNRPVECDEGDVQCQQALDKYIRVHHESRRRTHFFRTIEKHPEWATWEAPLTGPLAILTGYSALVDEVVRNGFAWVFNKPNPRTGEPRTLHDVVVQKSLHPDQQRLAVEDRLDYAQILSVLLYTATDCQDDMHRAHREANDFGRWAQLRAVLCSAISQLHRVATFTGWRNRHTLEPLPADAVASRAGYVFRAHESGDTASVEHDGETFEAERMFLYTGLRDTVFDYFGATLHGACYEGRSQLTNTAEQPHMINSRRLTYCDFLSSSMMLAAACTPRFLGNGGLLLQIIVDQNTECADVSWISRFGWTEAEVLFNPCTLYLTGAPMVHSLPRVPRSRGAAPPDTEVCQAVDAQVIPVTAMPLLEISD